jgi:hypothetical protein
MPFSQSRICRAVVDRLLVAAEAEGRTGSVIELLALRALTLQAIDDTHAALGVLARALSLAESEGYARVFLDMGVPMTRLLETVATRHWTGIRCGSAGCCRTSSDDQGDLCPGSFEGRRTGTSIG